MFALVAEIIRRVTAALIFACFVSELERELIVMLFTPAFVARHST